MNEKPYAEGTDNRLDTRTHRPTSPGSASRRSKDTGSSCVDDTLHARVTPNATHNQRAPSSPQRGGEREPVLPDDSSALATGLHISHEAVRNDERSTTTRTNNIISASSSSTFMHDQGHRIPESTHRSPASLVTTAPLLRSPQSIRVPGSPSQTERHVDDHGRHIIRSSGSGSGGGDAELLPALVSEVILSRIPSRSRTSSGSSLAVGMSGAQSSRDNNVTHSLSDTTSKDGQRPLSHVTSRTGQSLQEMDPENVNTMGYKNNNINSSQSTSSATRESEVVSTSSGITNTTTATVLLPRVHSRRARSTALPTTLWPETRVTAHRQSAVSMGGGGGNEKEDRHDSSSYDHGTSAQRMSLNRMILARAVCDEERDKDRRKDGLVAPTGVRVAPLPSPLVSPIPSQVPTKRESVLHRIQRTAHASLTSSPAAGQVSSLSSSTSPPTTATPVTCTSFGAASRTRAVPPLTHACSSDGASPNDTSRNSATTNTAAAAVASAEFNLCTPNHTILPLSLRMRPSEQRRRTLVSAVDHDVAQSLANLSMLDASTNSNNDTISIQTPPRAVAATAADILSSSSSTIATASASRTLPTITTTTTTTTKSNSAVPTSTTITSSTKVNANASASMAPFSSPALLLSTFGRGGGVHGAAELAALSSMSTIHSTATSLSASSSLVVADSPRALPLRHTRRSRRLSVCRTPGADAQTRTSQKTQDGDTKSRSAHRERECACVPSSAMDLLLDQNNSRAFGEEEGGVDMRRRDDSPTEEGATAVTRVSRSSVSRPVETSTKQHSNSNSNRRSDDHHNNNEELNMCHETADNHTRTSETAPSTLVVVGTASPLRTNSPAPDTQSPATLPPSPRTITHTRVAASAPASAVSADAATRPPRTPDADTPVQTTCSRNSEPCLHSRHDVLDIHTAASGTRELSAQNAVVYTQGGTHSSKGERRRDSAAGGQDTNVMRRSDEDDAQRATEVPLCAAYNTEQHPHDHHEAKQHQQDDEAKQRQQEQEAKQSAQSHQQHARPSLRTRSSLTSLPSRQSNASQYDFAVVASSEMGCQRRLELSVGVGSVQGRRRTMEDVHFRHLRQCGVHGREESVGAVSLVGVLDGHNGSRVAQLAAELIPRYFFAHSALGENNALALVESVLQADEAIYHRLCRPAARGRRESAAMHMSGTKKEEDEEDEDAHAPDATRAADAHSHEEGHVYHAFPFQPMSGSSCPGEANTAGAHHDDSCGAVGLHKTAEKRSPHADRRSPSASSPTLSCMMEDSVGGSTLIMAAVHRRILYVACLGDARAVLYDGQSTTAMSEDHKPGNAKEAERIERCGGMVLHGRVCGTLGVSRALGDFEYKCGSHQPTWDDAEQDEDEENDIANDTQQQQQHQQQQQQRRKHEESVLEGNSLGTDTGAASVPPPPQRQQGQGDRNYTNAPPMSSVSSSSSSTWQPGQRDMMVSNVADVRQINLSDASQFLILACDGLWDVVSNEEATQFVKDFLCYTPEVNDPAVMGGDKPRPPPELIAHTLDVCCQKLAEFAVESGSMDNVSVMVLFFHDVLDTVAGFGGACIPHAAAAMPARGSGEHHHRVRTTPTRDAPIRADRVHKEDGGTRRRRSPGCLTAAADATSSTGIATHTHTNTTTTSPRAQGSGTSDVLLPPRRPSAPPTPPWMMGGEGRGGGNEHAHTPGQTIRHHAVRRGRGAPRGGRRTLRGALLSESAWVPNKSSSSQPNRSMFHVNDACEEEKPMNRYSSRSNSRVSNPTHANKSYYRRGNGASRGRGGSTGGRVSSARGGRAGARLGPLGGEEGDGRSDGGSRCLTPQPPPRPT